jgi:hypothetical protein
MCKLIDDDRQFLKNFFAGYFNQDWTDDHNSSDEVVQQFMRDVPREGIDRLRALILNMLESDRDNEEMDIRLIRDFGCGFLPSGANLTVKEWLQSIVSILSPRSE